MNLLFKILCAGIALLHLYFAWFEIFAWVERGPVVFPMLAPDLFEKTTAMAANQGIYNAFLSAGLIWSLLIRDDTWQRHTATFFLTCVLVAGIFGAATVSTRILFVQALPALLALALLFVARRNSGSAHT